MQEEQVNCKYCYDKGYYTEFSGFTAHADFIGDETKTYNMKVREHPCKKCSIEVGEVMQEEIRDRFINNK